MSVFLQFFGSPFLKSTFLFWGLMFGCFVAGISTYEGKGSVWDSYEHLLHVQLVLASRRQGHRVRGPMKQGRQYKYFNDYSIRNAPWFTFLWAETFPLGFAPEYFFPILIGFFVSTAETIGDVTSSCKYLEARDGRARLREPPSRAVWNSTSELGFQIKFRGDDISSTNLTSRAASKAGCSRTASTRSSPASSRAPAEHDVLAEQRHHLAHAVRVTVRGLRVRVLVDSLRYHWQIRSCVELHTFRGRGPRAPVLQSPTVSVTSHVGRRSRGARNDLSRFPSRSDGRLGDVHRH